MHFSARMTHSALCCGCVQKCVPSGRDSCFARTPSCTGRGRAAMVHESVTVPQRLGRRANTTQNSCFGARAPRSSSTDRAQSCDPRAAAAGRGGSAPPASRRTGRAGRRRRGSRRSGTA
eukprot:5121356-Prymnesium_polylepis.1